MFTQITEKLYQLSLKKIMKFIKGNSKRNLFIFMCIEMSSKKKHLATHIIIKRINFTRKPHTTLTNEFWWCIPTNVFTHSDFFSFFYWIFIVLYTFGHHTVWNKIKKTVFLLKIQIFEIFKRIFLSFIFVYKYSFFFFFCF